MFIYDAIPLVDSSGGKSMNDCIDVGNTTIAMGFYLNDKFHSKMVHNTIVNRTEDEYVVLLNDTFSSLKINKGEIDRIIYSSVVPSINQPFKAAIRRVLNKEVLSVGPGIKTGLLLKVDNPSEVGSDLIADLVGAKEKYGYPTLVIDLGTASKILLIDRNGAFTSCLILPGLSLSAASLTSKAALLPEVSLETPKSVLAKNTVEAMNAGIVYGHADMILGLVNRYEKEIGYSCQRILTGGSAVYLKDIMGPSFKYDPIVTLDGLNIILRKNEVKL